MNSRPGRLSGGQIRTLPPDRVEGMLRRIKLEGSGKSRKVKSVRYRISGFRNPDDGSWISRNPRNGQYYQLHDGRHRTRARPTPEMLARSDMLALEVEITRVKGSRVYFVSIPGVR